MKRTIFGGVMILAAATQSIFAVPARPGVIKTLVQPDGTTVEVSVVGDESRHCYVTVDKVPLMRDDQGRYCYATVDMTGRAVASAFQARDIAVRTGVEKAFLSTLDTEAVGAKIFERRPDFLKTLSTNISAGIGLDPSDTCFPHEGDVHALVLLVQYSDVKFKVSDPADYYNRFLNEQGFADHNGTGSCRDFFMSVSDGKFRPTFDAVGPITLPRNQAYYGANDIWGNDAAPEQMVVDACKLIDEDVDFSQYDLDGDGEVDNIYVIYAGQGEASYGGDNTVWPHRWTLTSAGTRLTLDNVRIDNYGCCNEWDEIRPTGIGTFCHEFGHVMGLPDLYATNYGGAVNATPDYFDVMDRGSYNNDGRTPPTYSAYERNAMGWIDLKVLDGPDAITLENINDTNTACIILTDDKNEFFLLENRQLTGWDKYIPGHGLLIWHIDFDLAVWQDNAPNNDASHQHIDIVEAGGRANSSIASLLASYPFPGTSRVTSFTADTNPALVTWAGSAIDLPITNIVEKDGIITFDVAGGYVELSTPEPVASDVTPGGFTLTWPAVDKATSYTVDIYSKDEAGNILPTRFTAFETDVTSLVADRLAPETRYYATVVARRGAFTSDVSDELDILTAEADFEFAVPVALPATAVGADNFTATWQAVDGATGYLLSIEALRQLETAVFATDFGNNTSKATLPQGWTSSTTKVYASTGYFGESAPSLRLDTHGHYLMTPVLDEQITGYRFWARSTGMSTDNYVEVEVRADEQSPWILINTAHVLNSVRGETITSEVPDGMHQLRITFSKITNGNMAIDDMSVEVGGQKMFLLDGYAPKVLENVTSHTVIGLDPDVKQYTYTVQAVAADGRKSLVSDPVEVRTDASMGVGDSVIAPGSVEVELYNLQGMRITGTPAPGVYIRRIGSYTDKVYVR